MFRIRKLRWLVYLGALLLLVTPLFTACAAPEAPAPEKPAPAPQVYKWRMQMLLPPGHAHSRVTLPYWTNRVKEASGGRIEIETFPPAALAPAFETFKAVADGVLELAHTGASYHKGFIPVAEMGFGWPFTFERMDDLNYFLYEAGAVDVLRRAYAEHGVYHLGPYAPLRYAVPLTTVPINTLEDFKGLKIRCVGVFGEMMEELGASPVMIPMGEIYTAMSQGVIDGAILGGPGTLSSYKLFEVGKYLLWPGLQRYAYIETDINLELWNSLPNDLKVILESTHLDASAYGNSIQYAADASSLDNALKNQGLTLTRLPDDDWAKLRKLAMDALDARAEKDAYSAEMVKIHKDTLRKFGYID